jgi:hypothetical protein
MTRCTRGVVTFSAIAGAASAMSDTATVESKLNLVIIILLFFISRAALHTSASGESKMPPFVRREVSRFPKMLHVAVEANYTRWYIVFNARSHANKAYHASKGV